MKKNQSRRVSRIVVTDGLLLGILLLVSGVPTLFSFVIEGWMVNQVDHRISTPLAREVVMALSNQFNPVAPVPLRAGVPDSMRPVDGK